VVALMQAPTSTTGWLRQFPVVFWDFDGVIKDSVSVKSDAFEQLFLPYGEPLAQRIREHHERNGGMSRFEKLPIYMQWAGLEITPSALQAHLDAFASAVRQAVIDSAWVPGAREYLAEHHRLQCFIVVTATPIGEMQDILGALQIDSWFREVHGAPTRKAEAIAGVLRRRGYSPHQALLIGDSGADHHSAVATGIQFLLRRTALNADLQRTFTGWQCEDFRHG
jgi:phosphoglycolate phosphatase-like HAD superfamily hydrolase